MSHKTDVLRTWPNHKGVRFYDGRMGWQKVSCYNELAHPHGDRNPSASVNLATGHYKCFGCELEGDVYDLYIQEHGGNYLTAMVALGQKPEDRKEEDTWL